MIATIPRVLSLGVAAVAGLSMAAFAADMTPGGNDMEGFPSSAVAAEAQLEQRFDADLSATELREWLKHLGT